MLYLNGLPVPITIFSDNTSQVWKLSEAVLTQTNYARITWEFASEGEIMHLGQLKMLLQSHRIRASLILPYLPYGRQDKEVSNGTTFALHHFAHAINSMAFDEVIITDPHSEISLELIRGSKAIYPFEEVYSVIDQCGIDVLCYPDKGAVSKYTKIYEYHDHIYGEKVRDQLTGNILSYKLVGDPSGKNVLILDDICDGGMTFKLLAKDLLAADAKSVVLFVTHGLFSKGTRTLFESGIQRIFTKDGEKSNYQGHHSSNL